MNYNTKAAKARLNEILSDPIFSKIDLSEYLSRQYTVECIENLVEIMRDGENNSIIRLKAISMILDRAWGRPALAIKLSQEDKEKENSQKFIEGELAEAERKSKEIMELMKLGGQTPDSWNNSKIVEIED